MVIDSSALIAILQNEPESRPFRALLKSHPIRMMSAATFVETSIVVLARQGEPGIAELRAFLELAGVEIVPLNEEQALMAVDAFRRFGKGRHRASLNLGDCYSYSLARVMDQPLLFTGEDFVHTDVAKAAAERRL